jgi:hypothetical protein
MTYGFILRPTLLFVAAYMLTMTLHEITHALVAYLLGFSSTVFQLWVAPDTAYASGAQRALIALAGPIFNLALGTLGWIGYLRRPDGPSGLALLMLGIMGIYSFLGPLVGAALGGDVNIALRALQMPTPLRSAISAVGVVSLPCFMYIAGTELRRAAPLGASRTQAVLITVIAPWLIGTALAVVLYLPLPSVLIMSTLTGSIFWLFAVIGAWRRESSGQQRAYAVRFADVAFAVVPLLIVRALVNGVRLVP